MSGDELVLLAVSFIGFRSHQKKITALYHSYFPFLSSPLRFFFFIVSFNTCAFQFSPVKSEALLHTLVCFFPLVSSNRSPPLPFLRPPVGGLEAILAKINGVFNSLSYVSYQQQSESQPACFPSHISPS